MKRDEIIKSIEKIEELSNKLLQVKEEIKEDELEKYFYKFEKTRMDMYDDVRQTNLWLDFMDAEGIEINMNFIPSWNMKKEDEPTTHSRRYIGKLEYNNQDEFLVYAIYEGKDDKIERTV